MKMIINWLGRMNRTPTPDVLTTTLNAHTQALAAIKHESQLWISKIGLLQLVARGCSKHHGYRAIRKPRCPDCMTCVFMYEAATKLRETGDL